MVQARMYNLMIENVLRSFNILIKGRARVEEYLKRHMRTKEVPRMDIKTVLRKHENQIMRLPNVTGVGISEKKGKEVIVVFVTHKIPKSELRPQDIVPKILDGVETDVKVQIMVGKRARIKDEREVLSHGRKET